MKQYIRTFVIGLFTYVLLSQLKILYDIYIISLELTKFPALLLSFASAVLFMSIIIVPAYISGWISKDRGTIMGFLVGLIGSSYPFIIAITLKENAGFSLMEVVQRWFDKAMLASVVGAVSGAAGQLHQMAYAKRRDEQRGVRH